MGMGMGMGHTEIPPCRQSLAVGAPLLGGIHSGFQSSCSLDVQEGVSMVGVIVLLEIEGVKEGERDTIEDGDA